MIGHRKARLVLFLLLAGFALFALHSPNWGDNRVLQQPPSESKEEIYKGECDGLGASVSAVRWCGKDRISFRYRLQWTAPVEKRPTWVIDNFTVVGLSFWDGQGKELSDDSLDAIFKRGVPPTPEQIATGLRGNWCENIILGEAFVRGEAPLEENAVEIGGVPKEARYFAVYFARTGVDTPKIPLPMRP